MDKYTSRGLDFDHQVISKPFATYFSSGFRFPASSPNLMALLSLNAILFIDQHLIAVRPYLIGLQLAIGASFRKSFMASLGKSIRIPARHPSNSHSIPKTTLWTRPRGDSICDKYALITLQSPANGYLLILT